MSAPTVQIYTVNQHALDVTIDTTYGSYTNILFDVSVRCLPLPSPCAICCSELGYCTKRDTVVLQQKYSE